MKKVNCIYETMRGKFLNPLLMLLLLGVAGLTKGYAYDFSKVCSTGQTLYYNITDATNYYVEITCPGGSSWNGFVKPTGNITLPSSVSYNGVTYAVKAIGYAAFYECSGLTGSLIIPNSVTTISHWAFTSCSGFTGTLTIPSSVTELGNSVFRDCSGFTHVDYKVTNCADPYEYNTPFENCGGTLTLGNNVTRIPSYMFKDSNFTGLLSIPSFVTTIGNSAFGNCSGFVGSLTLSNSLTTIGDWAFYNCNGFTSIIVLPETPPSLGTGVFLDVPKNIPVTVPCGTLNTYQSASGWNEFTNMTAYCDPLTYSINPDGVSVTVTGHVDGTAATGELFIPEAKTLNGVTYVVTRIGNYAFKNCIGLTGPLTIPSSVTEIGYAAFYECGGFTNSLTIPSSVTTINGYAFFNCDGLTGTLTIPSSVTMIDYCAFYACSGFTGSLNIPNSVTTIGDWAFAFCTGFTGSLTIGTAVTSIGHSTFKASNGFTQVNYNAVNCADVASDAKPFKSCGGSLTIGDNVQRIPAYMFNDAGCSGTLTIGTGLTTIGTSAFKDCTHFTNVVFNATSCEDAEYLSYPFENCTGGLTIGNNVTRIPANIFAYANFTGNLFIPDAVTTIGYSAFYDCSDLNGYLTLGSSLTTIGIYAFYSCSGLTGSLTIPNSVTKLDIYAFALCSGFTGVTIGSSVTMIDYGAFYGCYGLTFMTVRPETPPTLGDDVFFNVPRNIPVYVPCIALDDYQDTEIWNEFNLQCSPKVTVTAVPTNGGSVSGGGTFTYGSQCNVTAIPNSNYLFMHWSKNGEVVNCNAVYSFYVYDDTELEAVFVPKSSAGTIIGEGEAKNENLPSNSFYRYALTEQIYTAAELGGSRTITNISFFNAGSTRTRSFDIYMRHTTKTSFSSTTDWVSVSSSYKVFSGTVEMRAGQWTTIVLNTPFTYNGTSNLLLVVDDNTGSYSYGMSCRVYDANGYQAIYVRSDDTNYNPGSPSSYTGTRMSVKNQIMFNRPQLYNITATSSNTTMGTVNGGGMYGAGDICRLKATAKPGYTFLNWVDANGVTLSTDVNYSFMVTGNKTLTANFLSGSGMCRLTFDLFGSYSDSWSGNYLVVDYEDGTSVKLTTSIDYNDTYTLPFENGSHVELSIIEGGWISECSFTILYENGDVMYIGSYLDEEYYYNFDMDCSEQPSEVTYVGDHSTANNYYLPSYSYYNYSLSEQIYTAEEIGGSGYITCMAFYNSGAQETRYYNIYLATTDKTAFENQTDWINASDAVLVYSGSVTMHADKWTPINFNENPFDYDGVSNLVLIVDDNSGNYTGSPHMSCLVYETESLQALRVYSDNNNYNPMSPPTSYSNYEYAAVMNVKNQVLFGMVPCYEPTDLYAYSTFTSADVLWSSSHHHEFEVQYGLVSPNNDFEDGLGYWTTIDADGDGYGWELATEATSYFSYASNLAGTGHNASTDFVTSGSYINGYGPLTPDNYLVSPRVTLGGSISFWVCLQDANWPGEHFGVAVSTTGNTNASDFFTIQEWTMTAKSTGAKVDPGMTRSGNRDQGDWYEYTVDLSAYAGQTGYVAIRHFNCTDMFMLNVDDITIVQPGINPNMTTIHGVTDMYVALSDLLPGFLYEVRVRSNCSRGFFSDWISTIFTTEPEITTVTQTIELSQGTNWFSTYLEITLDDLKAALVAALPGTTSIKITSQSNGTTTYNGTMWRGALNTLDVTQMYMIEVAADCEITLEGTGINPAEHPVTIHNGNNWIAFPLSGSMTLSNAFAGFAVNGDKVTSQSNGSATYTNQWRGQLSTLEPGKGYMYYSNRPGSINFIFVDSHEYVDLGLPSGTLWATCNVGATTPVGYGDHFAWGETQRKYEYSWDTYQYGDGTTFTKYTGSDGLITLLPEDDAATANWGANWCMPTKEEWEELYQNTTHTWTTQNGVNGCLFTASNGNSLFLPAAGYRYDSNFDYGGSGGRYWSSSLYTSYPGAAWNFLINSDDYGTQGYLRQCGQSVRAVRSSRQN